MSDVKQKTNGDVVNSMMTKLQKNLYAMATEAVAHPDEFAVAAMPVLFAISLGLKYRFELFEQILLSNLAVTVVPLLLHEYRDWKKSPAKPALRRVV